MLNNNYTFFVAKVITKFPLVISVFRDECKSRRKIDVLMIKNAF